VGVVAIPRPQAEPTSVTRPVSHERAGAVEVLAVAGLTLLVLGITALPYLYGYLIAGADRVFMGIVMNVPDTAQYFSWARESQHSILIENKLTPEHGAAVFFNLFWLVVGRLAATLGLGIAETTQLVRPLAGAVYIGAIYWFVGLVTRTRLQRWTAFLVAALGGGLGWLLVVGKQFSGVLSAPLDLYVTEPNTFLSVLAFPHQAMAGGLQVVIFGLAALAFERKCGRRALAAGLLALALGVQHGYDLLIVYAVVGVTGLLLVLRDGGWLRMIWLGALVCVPAMPAALYLFALTRISPIWQGVLAQYGNAGVYTPSPLHLLVLMGLPLLVVLGGVALLIARRAQLRGWFERAPARELLVWAWLIVGCGLLYIPTDFQIKMLAGWQVPVALAATWLLLERMVPALARRSHFGPQPRLAQVVAFLFVALVLPVNVYLLSWRFVDLGRRDYPYFLQTNEVAALHWLESNSAPQDVVLSSMTLGQYVPAVAGNNAFLAHWAQTLDFYTKGRLVNSVFDARTSDADRKAILDQYGVNYVLHGDPERALGDYDPVNSDYLERVDVSGRVSVYRVEHAARQP
jgi:hypothetical protein